MWNLVLWPGTEPGPPALGAQIPNLCTTREVLPTFKFAYFFVFPKFPQGWGGNVDWTFMCILELSLLKCLSTCEFIYFFLLQNKQLDKIYTFLGTADPWVLHSQIQPAENLMNIHGPNEHLQIWASMDFDIHRGILEPIPQGYRGMTVISKVLGTPHCIFTGFFTFWLLIICFMEKVSNHWIKWQ